MPDAIALKTEKNHFRQAVSVCGKNIQPGQPIYGFFGNWHDLLALWALLALAVLPLGIRDLIRVQGETWKDMVVEETAHE